MDARAWRERSRRRANRHWACAPRGRSSDLVVVGEAACGAGSRAAVTACRDHRVTD
jgi:hypothetical protein